jgi:Zn finger protein HypA/HybF (possibly regulating hydrogenase expression)
MHELGVVFHIAKSVERVAAENGVKKVNKVVLEVGEVSAIVNSYLVDCWDWNAKRSEVLNGCQLEIVTISSITYCEDCGEKYETVKYGKTCPNCKSGNTYLLQGNETNIKQIEVEEPSLN